MESILELLALIKNGTIDYIGPEMMNSFIDRLRQDIGWAIIDDSIP
jgi:hypothetical protein